MYICKWKANHESEAWNDKKNTNLFFAVKEKHKPE
jgi:hypothetical protein